MKKKITLILSLILLILLSNNLKVSANTIGQISVNKSATKEDITYKRNANIELEVNATNKEKSKLDIVLLIDRSSSMNNKIKNENKIVLAKEATINFINNLIKNDNINIGIVTFGQRVHDKYSTNNMAYSKENLIKLVNSIPNNSNEYGTNIQEALIKSNDLLKVNNGNKKIVILLSDGSPTRFTYNNKVFGSGYYDVCYKYEKGKCVKSSPSKMAISIANDIKKYADIYTIGFDIKKNSSAEKFLKNDIASNETNYYLTVSDLNKTFNDILKNITIIANNTVVTDTIPANFNLIENSITSTNKNIKTKINNDGTTTITWEIGNIDITKKYTLNYKVEAKTPYYGNMFTNVSAYLEGIPTENNKFYKENILIYFNKPTVPIPSITNDDDYKNKPVYRNEELIVSAENGLLKNDYLTKIKDNNIDSINNIIIKPNSLSCGSINDLHVNNDGSFTYKSNLDCLGNISFKYYITSLINDTEVISNTSKVTLNVIKKEVTYKVKYLDYETKTPLKDEKIVSNKYLYDEVNESYIDIENYNLIGEKTINKTITKDNDEIIFYYILPNNLTYIVNYYYDNILSIDSREIVINNKQNDIISNYKEKKKYGYVLDYKENLPLTISGNIEENVINIYYKKMPGNVIIKYIDNQGKEIKEPFIIKKLVGEEYNTSKESINGYELINIIGNESGLVEENDTIITYIYDFIVPKTGVIDNYNKEIISIFSIIGIIVISIKKFIIK